MQNAQLLSAIGEALYGSQWMNALAGLLRVSDRSMRRWANGTDPVPWGVWHDLQRHVDTRSTELSFWKDVLKTRVFANVEEPMPNYDHKSDWLLEVHDPESARHSNVATKVLPSLAELEAEMQRHAGMIFRVLVPENVSRAEWDAFQQLKLARVFP